MAISKELALLREEIDFIDYQIHDLVNQRGQLALKVADAKIKAEGPNVTFYKPEREQQILKRIEEYNEGKGPLKPAALATIFKSIMLECLNLQINQHPEVTNDH